jgi:hypothetical protein
MRAERVCPPLDTITFAYRSKGLHYHYGCERLTWVMFVASDKFILGKVGAVAPNVFFVLSLI